MIALRSDLDYTHLNAPLKKRRMVTSSARPHCGQEETINHVLLLCPRYQQARLRFLNSLGHKPPDKDTLLICLGRTENRTNRDKKQTNEEHCSGQFLLDIDELRPGL